MCQMSCRRPSLVSDACSQTSRLLSHDLTVCAATDAQVDAAKAIIERYQKKLAFNPDHYPNPALNYHYAVLKATAFQEPLPETMVDHTVPQYAMIRKVSNVCLSLSI